MKKFFLLIFIILSIMFIFWYFSKDGNTQPETILENNIETNLTGENDIFISDYFKKDEDVFNNNEENINNNIKLKDSVKKECMVEGSLVLEGTIVNDSTCVGNAN